MQATLIGLAAAAGAVAGAASLAERRRSKRRAINGIGWMPWPPLIVAATFTALVLLAVGLKA